MPLVNGQYEARRSDEWETYIRERVDERIAAAGQPPVDYDRDTLFGALTAIMALALGAQDESVQQIADQRNPANARGPARDDIALLSDTVRAPATRSTALAALTGTPGTLVPEGLLVRGGDLDEDGEIPRWRLTSDVVIGVSGSAEGTFEALKVGPITADLGAIDTILTNIAGLADATNGQAATPGRAPATDAELERQRRIDIAGQGSNNLGATVKAVSAVDNVQYVRGVQNRAPTPQTVEGVALPENSYSVVVYPPNLSPDQEQAIHDAIRLHGPAGIKPVGTEVGQSLIPDTQPPQLFDSAFNYAAKLEVDVEVRIELSDSTYRIEDMEEVAKAAVAVYQQELNIGAKKVRRIPLIAELEKTDGIDYVEVLYDGADADISIEATQYVILNDPTVTEI